MKLCNITEEYIGKKVQIDQKFGTFVGVVAWVERDERLVFNKDNYYETEYFGRNHSVTNFAEYTGQVDYYQKETTVSVGFYGDTSKTVTWKEDYDIAKENPNLEDYLRKYHGGSS